MQIQKYQSFQWSWTLFIVLGLAMMGMGSQAMGVSNALDIVATGFFIAGGTMIMVGLIYTLPSSNTLEIAEDGFSYRAGWHRIFCKWEQCSEFSPWEKNLFGMTANELVTFDSDNPAAQSKTNVKATGQNAVLPGTFGLPADELARKMNHFRQMQISRLEKPVQTFL